MYCIANVPEAWSIFSEKWRCFLWRSCAWYFGEEHEIGSLRSGAQFQIHRLQRLESSRFQEAFLDLSKCMIIRVNAFTFHGMIVVSYFLDPNKLSKQSCLESLCSVWENNKAFMFFMQNDAGDVSSTHASKTPSLSQFATVFDSSVVGMIFWSLCPTKLSEIILKTLLQYNS